MTMTECQTTMSVDDVDRMCIAHSVIEDDAARRSDQ